MEKELERGYVLTLRLENYKINGKLWLRKRVLLNQSFPLDPV